MAFWKQTGSNSVRERILKKNFPSISWNKTVLAMLIMGGIALTAIFLLFQMTAQVMAKNVRLSMEQTVEQQRIHFDFRLRSVQQEAEKLMTIIYPLMSGSDDPVEQYQEFEQLKSTIGLTTSNTDISGVRLYVPSDKIYSHEGATFLPMWELLKQGQDQPYLEKAGISWLETQPVSVIDPYGSRDIEALTCAYSMRQKTNYANISCVLMLDVRVSNFDELLSVEGEPNQYGFLVNSQGISLACPDTELLGQQVVQDELMEQIREDSGGGSITRGGSVYVFRKLSNFDWYLVMKYPSSMLSVGDSLRATFLKILVVVVLMVALFIVFVLAYHFTSNLTLTRINATLEALNHGTDQSGGEQAPEFLDPLHHLERNTDQMVLTINELMEDRYKDRLAIAESQMESLQAQIKPHFLYNTLDIIKWMILDNKDADAVWMVNALSKYLRQSINKGPAIIPLREELELSRNYVQIMQKRFDNRFQAHFEIEEGVEECWIPKLSLQPLLENALLHGVLYSEKPDKMLYIRAWQADGMLNLEVEDNGKGMTEEQCTALEEGHSGYGFSNVLRRLELFAKGNSQCHIFSREGVGTCISIQIPATVQENAFDRKF